MVRLAGGLRYEKGRKAKQPLSIPSHPESENIEGKKGLVSKN